MGAELRYISGQKDNELPTIRSPWLDSEMVKISGYDVVTFQRKPGKWRASIAPIDDTRRSSGIATRQMRSFLTESDCATEAEAEQSAVVAIRNLQT